MGWLPIKLVAHWAELAFSLAVDLYITRANCLAQCFHVPLALTRHIATQKLGFLTVSCHCLPTDVGMDEGGVLLTEPRGGFAGPSGRGGSWGNGGGGRRPMARLQSPPCYRNIFADEDSEEPYAAWKAARPQQQQLSRYRCGTTGWPPNKPGRACTSLVMSAQSTDQRAGMCCAQLPPCNERPRTWTVGTAVAAPPHPFAHVLPCPAASLNTRQAGLQGGGPAGAGQLLQGVPGAAPL